MKKRSIFSIIAGVILIIIGIIGIPIPIFPGIVLIILGLSLLGFNVIKKIKKVIKKESQSSSRKK